MALKLRQRFKCGVQTCKHTQPLKSGQKREHAIHTHKHTHFTEHARISDGRVSDVHRDVEVSVLEVQAHRVQRHSKVRILVDHLGKGTQICQVV